MNQAKAIGLTGGIATGKSTATAYLARQGYTVIDADQIVRDLQAPGGPLYQIITDLFGNAFLATDGSLDRLKLSAHVFAHPTELAKLSEREDPIILAALTQAKAAQEKSETQPLFFMDIPLLFESPTYRAMVDATWLVYAPRPLQLTRLMARNQLTASEAAARIATQLPIEQKRQLADVILDNTTTPAALYRQIEAQLAHTLERK